MDLLRSISDLMYNLKKIGYVIAADFANDRTAIKHAISIKNTYQHKDGFVYYTHDDITNKDVTLRVMSYSGITHATKKVANDVLVEAHLLNLRTWVIEHKDHVSIKLEGC